jgi:hypothetical protein
MSTAHEYTPQDLAEMGAKLQHFAERYKELAERMKAKKVDRIPADNDKSFWLAISNITKACNRSWLAFDESIAGERKKK